MHFLSHNQLSHPTVDDWHSEEQDLAQRLVAKLGDTTYYEAAKRTFERQVEAYGRDKLVQDVARFRKLLARLEKSCKDTFVISETLHIPDQVSHVWGVEFELE